MAVAIIHCGENIRCARKRTTEEKDVITVFRFGSKPTDTKDLSRNDVLTKTSSMALINIDDLLPEDLDLTTLDWDASTKP